VDHVLGRAAATRRFHQFIIAFQKYCSILATPIILASKTASGIAFLLRLKRAGSRNAGSRMFVRHPAYLTNRVEGEGP